MLGCLIAKHDFFDLWSMPTTIMTFVLNPSVAYKLTGVAQLEMKSMLESMFDTTNQWWYTSY